ncbi:hypothetical protein RFI_32465 [Reticulomyxa filosa]|uniref:Uncharacterized protein n=1 Tax=Reticulomyxa filosa TaxID=46433 RepID=X6LW56_RETFI|nr:hypothetical protein RFI_32465 [Reticulomyxa filosa]|eukprot:ETO04930.1 hypothetical protein RFI_32465 [Reticulomyxa filosa]
MTVRELFDVLKEEDETVTEEEQRKQAVFSCMINSDIKKCDYLKTKQLRSLSSMACQLEESLFTAKLLKKGVNSNLANQINRISLMECCLRGMRDSNQKNLIIINK